MHVDHRGLQRGQVSSVGGHPGGCLGPSQRLCALRRRCADAGIHCVGFGANDWLSEGQGGGWMAAVRREMDESIAIVEDVMSRRYEPSCVTEREP